MVLTPSSNAGLSLMNGSLHLGLRLTPSSHHASPSPYTPGKSSPLRSPVKTVPRTELGLSLKQVIGSTASSKNAFDAHGNSFAFTAGAAAVIATYDPQTHQVEQRFYRARPTASPVNPSPVIYDNGTPTTLRSTGPGMSPSGTPSGDWGDSSTGKSWSAKERVKAATCVSFSPDGKFLAVGETGYRPRVLIFSTSNDASNDIPLTSITDHAFGVRCVAFSSDSQYLATLGGANDGFLYVWRIQERNGAATLLASNKCLSNISQIAWMGNKLITIGTRHVKVWRLDQSGPSTPVRPNNLLQSTSTADNRILLGRNCVLGDLLEATFTSIVCLDASSAILCSDKGTICHLDDRDNQQRFTKICEVSFAISAALLVGRDRVLLAGARGQLQIMSVGQMKANMDSELVPRNRTLPEEPCSFVEISGATSESISAFALLENGIGTVDTRGVIRVSELDGGSSETTIWNCVYKLPAHGGPVLGVRTLREPTEFGATFFTWSGDGNVIFWDDMGKRTMSVVLEVEQLSSEEGLPNELRVAQYLATRNCLVTGDRYGIFRLYDITKKSDVYNVRAHSGEITDIAVHDGDSCLVATCGRDRTIQVFFEKEGTWDLLHTLDEHVGAVNSVLFTKASDHLLSCSADRTIVVRDRASRQVNGRPVNAYIIARTITLKATPAAMVFDSIHENVVFVSTVDRTIHKYDCRTGRLLGSFKTGDNDRGDPIVLSSLVTLPTLMGGSILAGLSSTDKSIRLYEENGTMLGRDYGHTEGTTGIAVLNGPDSDSASLITVALDGTIFGWRADINPRKRNDPFLRSLDSANGTPTGTLAQEKDAMILKMPLRRVLSQSEVARFQKSPDLDETPTRQPGQRSPPRVRKRSSRLSLLQTPKLEPSPSARQDPSRRRSIRRSPSPPSPRSASLHGSIGKRRQTMDPTTRRISMSRTKSMGNLRETSGSSASFSSSATHSLLARDIDAVCRALRIFRRKLGSSTEHLSTDMARELERELSANMRTLGEKVMQGNQRQREAQKDRGKAGVDEEALGRMLDQYSERLVELLDERLAGLSLSNGEKNKGKHTMSGIETDVGTASASISRTDSLAESIEEHEDEDE